MAPCVLFRRRAEKTRGQEETTEYTWGGGGGEGCVFFLFILFIIFKTFIHFVCSRGSKYIK